MDITVSLLGIAGAITIGAISPGPSFVMVARTALVKSRRDGLAAALGMGVGGVVFAAAALLGLQVLLAAVPWLYWSLKLLGGAYLVYLGYRIWRGASGPLVIEDGDSTVTTSSLRRSFLLGLVTQLSNPKTAIVYASIFAALLPREFPAWVLLALPGCIFAIEAGWYSLVAWALSSPSPRAAYLRFKTWIDRATGGVMALLGARLISTS